MKQSKLEALLGRSLTSRETANKDLYLSIARESLENLTCLDLSCENVEEERTYESREGYRTVFIGVFTEVLSVKVNGVTVDASNYRPAFFDKRNGPAFNSIVFNSPLGCDEDVTVNAVWGFESLPDDLARLEAQLFANASKKYAAERVKSKRVEDFSVTYADGTDEQAFVNQNAGVLAKYSICTVGNFKHGSTNADRF